MLPDITTQLQIAYPLITLDRSLSTTLMLGQQQSNSETMEMVPPSPQDLQSRTFTFFVGPEQEA